MDKPQYTFTISAHSLRNDRMVSMSVSSLLLHEVLMQVFRKEGLDVGPNSPVFVRDDFWGSENCLTVSRGR